MGMYHPEGERHLDWNLSHTACNMLEVESYSTINYFAGENASCLSVISTQ